MDKNKISRGERQRMRHFQDKWEKEKQEEIKIPQSIAEIKVIPTEDFFSLELKKIQSDNKLSDKEKKRLETLAVEKEKKKKEITAQLRKNPIVQYACDRTGTGRSTYYKWRADDLIFARAADRAIQAGCFLINDLAESKLIGLIQGSSITAIIFWLKHNHPKYAEVNRIIHEYEVVTERPSVEESNVADNEMAKMISDKIMPKYTTKELKEKIEGEMEEAERNAKLDERLRSFEEEEEK